MKIIRNILTAYFAVVPFVVNASVNEVENATIQYRITSAYACNTHGALDPAFYPANIEIRPDLSLHQSRLVYEIDQDGDSVIRTNYNAGHRGVGGLLPIGQDDQGNIIAKRKEGKGLSDTTYIIRHQFCFGYTVETMGEGKPCDFYLTQRMYSYPVLNLGVMVEGDGRKNLAHIIGQLSEGAIRPDEFASIELQTTIYKPLVAGEKIRLKLARDIHGNPTLIQEGSFYGPRKMIDRRLLETASKLARDVRSMLQAAVSQE